MITITRLDGTPVLVEERSLAAIVGRADSLADTESGLENSADGRIETVTFNQRRNIATAPLAPVAGTLDPEAAAFFGTMEVHRRARIQFLHVHQMVDGSGGTTTAEVYRRRSGVNTLIATVSLAAGGGDHQRGFSLPEDSGANLVQRQDYLYCQLTAVQTGSPLGLTVDVHFD